MYYNTFISERIKEGEFSNGIYFKIEKVRGQNDKENFNAKKILENGTSDIESNRFRGPSKSEQDGGGIKSGNKRSSHSFENFYGRKRKSAIPKFLSG